MIHIALIGLGGMGSRWAGVISGNTSLDAVVDSGIKGTPSFKDVLDDDYINAVIIAVPHNSLYWMTRDALKAGKHVLCEKPGTINSKELKKNMRLAKRKNLVYKIGYNYRFHDAFIKAREFFNDGVIGDLVFIRARHGFGGRIGYEREWRINEKIGGGGHLHDQGVHMIDMAKSFMGKIKDVRGFRSDNYWKSGTEDNAFVLLKDQNGVMASIHSSLTQWKRMHSFEIYGTKGYLSIEGLGKRYGDGERLIIGNRTGDAEREIECDSVADHSLTKELNEFVSAILFNTPVSPTPTECCETLRIVEKIYRKSKI